MANLRISEFEINDALSGSEVVLGVQSGNTRKISMDDIKTFSKQTIGDHVAANQLLTDISTSYLNLALESDSNYVIHFVLMFDNGNTDGLRINPSGGEDILVQNIAYTVDNTSVGIFSTDIDLMNGELDIADATSVLFVKGTGLIKTSVGAGSNDFGFLVKIIDNIIGTTELLAGSYLTATKI